MLSISISTALALVTALAGPSVSAAPLGRSLDLTLGNSTVGYDQTTELGLGRRHYCPGSDHDKGIIIMGVKPVKARKISGWIDQCDKYWHIAAGNFPKEKVEWEITDQEQTTKCHLAGDLPIGKGALFLFLETSDGPERSKGDFLIPCGDPDHTGVSVQCGMGRDEGKRANCGPRKIR